MAALTDFRISFVCLEAGQTIEALPEKRVQFGSASLLPKRERISLTASSFNALTPPTGAVGVYIDPGSATSLTLKGLTADAGVALTPATSPVSLPIVLSLSGATLGILNGSTSAQVITAVWF